MIKIQVQPLADIKHNAEMFAIKSQMLFFEKKMYYIGVLETKYEHLCEQVEELNKQIESLLPKPENHE